MKMPSEELMHLFRQLRGEAEMAEGEGNTLYIFKLKALLCNQILLR